MTLPSSRSLIAMILGCSTVLSLSGMFIVMAFDQAPGERSSAPPQWPSGSRLLHSAGNPEMLVFVHPFCSCTLASVAELEYMVARRRPDDLSPSITFVVYRPGTDSKWTWHSLQSRASTLPGVRFAWDDGGVEARRFGVKTSGNILLYSSGGDLLFDGGVTGSRGHEGENDGLTALMASLRKPARPLSGTRTSQTFGCAITLASPQKYSGTAPEQRLYRGGEKSPFESLRLFMGRLNARLWSPA